MHEIFQKLYLQVISWILSLFGVCKSACLRACDNAMTSNMGGNLMTWAQNLHKSDCDQTSSSDDDSSKDRCIKFAFFDLVETECGLSIKTLPYRCGFKRYSDIWFDLIQSYGFKNYILGSVSLLLYPFISMYILTWMPWIFWSLVWFQISWWFYSLGLSIALLIVTIPLYLLCIIVSVMVVCSTWIPIIGAILGIGGIGPAHCKGGMGGCPFMPAQIYWNDLFSYICCTPLLKLYNLKVCKNDADCDYDCDCEDCCDDPCPPTEPTTTEPTTTQPPQQY
jgi:hypothetical protein